MFKFKQNKCILYVYERLALASIHIKFMYIWLLEWWLKYFIFGFLPLTKSVCVLEYLDYIYITYII